MKDCKLQKEMLIVGITIANWAFVSSQTQGWALQRGRLCKLGLKDEPERFPKGFFCLNLPF